MKQVKCTLLVEGLEKYLTLNKIYNVVYESLQFYEVIDDTGKSWTHYKHWFDRVNEEIQRQV